MNSRELLSLAICTYNRAQLLSGMLESLAQQTLSPDKFEVLIINNNSTDNTREVIEAFKQAHPYLQLRNIFEPKQGLSHARNTAYMTANSTYLVYVDDDEILRPNFLEAYYESILKNSEYTVIGGRIAIHPIPNKPKWFSKSMEGWYSIYDLGEKPIEITAEKVLNKQIELPVGGNFAIQVDFLKEIEGFDPNLGRNKDLLLSGEETKVFQEALKRGRKILYEPSAVVEHVIESERLTISHVQEKFYVAGKSSCLLKYAQQPRPHVSRFLIGKAVYILSFLKDMLSVNSQRRFEAWLKLLFECGFISEYLVCSHAK